MMATPDKSGWEWVDPPRCSLERCWVGNGWIYRNRDGERVIIYVPDPDHARTLDHIETERALRGEEY
jgi:hypothetical protein